MIVKYTIDDIRSKNEQEMLFGSLAILAIVLSFFGILTLGAFVAVVAVAVLYLKLQQVSFLGGCVMVSDKHFPVIHNLGQTAARRLQMPMPPLFIRRSPELNAFAVGFMGKHSVVLHSALVEAFTEQEMLQVLGHEFAHIRFKHTTWNVLIGSAGSLGIPVLSPVLSFMFRFWSRTAEYTCDRAGLLCSRSVDAALSSMGKLAVGKELFAQLRLDHLMEQSSSLSKDSLGIIAEALATHPFLVKRMNALREFFDTDTYKNLTKTP